MFWKNMSKDVKEKYFALAREVDKEHKRKYPGTSRNVTLSFSLRIFARTCVRRSESFAESFAIREAHLRPARDRILGTRRGVAASRRRGVASRSRAGRLN